MTVTPPPSHDPPAGAAPRSVPGESASPLAMALAARLSGPADPDGVARVAARMWVDIGAALQPVIGTGGVDALWGRSLYLTARQGHSWLGATRIDAAGAVDESDLQARIAQQPVSAALAGVQALLQAFHGLLDSLIGTSLTERLLHPVWHSSAGEPSAQEDST
jgi:hypothetical protein